MPGLKQAPGGEATSRQLDDSFLLQRGGTDFWAQRKNTVTFPENWLLSKPTSAQEKLFVTDDFQTTADAVDAAVTHADNNGGGQVVISKDLLPYNKSQVTFRTAVELIEEGTSSFDVQVQAYGGSVADALNAKDPTVPEKWPHIIKAEWWISQGDGTPASPYEDGTGTAGIQPAVNYLRNQNTGGRILLPRGVSRFNSMIDMAGYAFNLVGHGRARTWNLRDDEDVPTLLKFEPSNVDTDAFRVHGDSNGPTRGTIFEDFHLDGDADGNANARDGIVADAQDSNGRYGDALAEPIDDLLFKNLLVSQFPGNGLALLGTTFHINAHNCWLAKCDRGYFSSGVHSAGPPSQHRLTGQGFTNANRIGVQIDSNDCYIENWGSTSNDTGWKIDSVVAVMRNIHAENDNNITIDYDSNGTNSRLYLDTCNVTGATTGVKFSQGGTVFQIGGAIKATGDAVDLTVGNAAVFFSGQQAETGSIASVNGWAQTGDLTGIIYDQGVVTIPAGGTLRLDYTNALYGTNAEFHWSIDEDPGENVAITERQLQNTGFAGSGGSLSFELTEETGLSSVKVRYRLRIPGRYNRISFAKNVATGELQPLRNDGQATLLSGNTSVTVSHGLNVTPDPQDIHVNALADLGSASYFYITNVGASSFDIVMDTDPTQNVDFAWSADVR